MKIMSFYLNVIGGMCVPKGENTKKINMDLFLLIVSVSWRLMSNSLAMQVQ